MALCIELRIFSYGRSPLVGCRVALDEIAIMIAKALIRDVQNLQHTTIEKFFLFERTGSM